MQIDYNIPFILNDCARRMIIERNAISILLNIYQHFRSELKSGKIFLVDKSFSIQNQFFSSNHDVIQFSFIFFHRKLNQSILYHSYIISLLNKVDEYGRIKNYFLGESSKFKNRKFCYKWVWSFWSFSISTNSNNQSTRAFPKQLIVATSITYFIEQEEKE